MSNLYFVCHLLRYRQCLRRWYFKTAHLILMGQNKFGVLRNNPEIRGPKGVFGFNQRRYLIVWYRSTLFQSRDREGVLPAHCTLNKLGLKVTTIFIYGIMRDV